MEQYLTLIWVLTGLSLMGMASAWTGLFLSLKGDMLSGDVIAHGVLPGIALAFMVTGTRELYYLAPAAFLSGWATLEIRDRLVQKAGIRPDTAAAMALSVFYGLGILLMSYIRSSGSGAQSGLDRFLFGSAASILPGEIIFSSVLALITGGVVLLRYRAFRFHFFDRQWAEACGFAPARYDRLLTLMTLACVVTGIQMAGVVLMSSFLIAPAVAVAPWTPSLQKRIPWVAGISVLGIVAGALTSFRFENMPTGPWVVVWLTLIAFASLVLKMRTPKVTRHD